VKVIKTKTKKSKKKKENKDSKFEAISTYNGDSCEKYNWSQGTNEVQIQFKLPKNTSAKQIKVDFKSTHLKITIKDEPFFEADFCEKIKVDDTYWTCEDANSLVLFICKLTDLIWKSAFKGEKEIDTKTVDNSKRLEEFDNDTQAALRKIMYEQNRKKKWVADF